MIPTLQDSILIRLNVIANIGMKVADSLIDAGVGVLIFGAGAWLMTSAMERGINIIERVHFWTKHWPLRTITVIVIVFVAMLCYAAGVYAFAWRPY